MTRKALDSSLSFNRSPVPHSPYAVIRWKRYKEENKDEARELVDKLEVEGGQDGEQDEDEEE